MESRLIRKRCGRQEVDASWIGLVLKRNYTLFLFLLVGGCPAGLLHNIHRGRVKVVLVITDGAIELPSVAKAT
eukprot:scaffold10482_cov89-Skeletonema_marinoi.AAC.5